MSVDSSSNNPDMDVRNELSLEDFKTWSTMALKTFLSLRKKAVTGSHETLSARAFAAYEEHVPVDVEQEHAERVLLKEYKDKLELDDSLQSLPDPMELKAGWVGEENGMKFWPHVYLTDITRFYRDVINKKDLIQRIECEYKQGKAYRYFTNNFIQEVFVNNVNEDSKYCILPTKCLPSQRISQISYTVWAIVRKDENDVSGGEIKSAYCTCTAGLIGSCNHVAGLLFRVEAAVLTGVAHPTCTSRLSEWNVPKGKKQIRLGEITSFLFVQDTYAKKAVSTFENSKLKLQSRLNFKTMSGSQAEKLEDKQSIREDFFSSAHTIIPKSCFVELMQGKKNRVTTSTYVPSLNDFAESFKENCSPELNIEDLNDIFTDSLLLSTEQIKEIYKQTTEQSNSDEWKSQRKGRLTASRFSEINKCSKRLKEQKINECPVHLVANIMGYSEFRPTWQMKHGINTEVHAKAKYKTLFKKSHLKSSFKDPGMTVMESHPFISASPDLEVQCQCHGPRLVEIKCPASIIGQVPSPQNYDHIEVVDDTLSLKRSSPYFSQVQGQMAITNCLTCDFFVFTFKGNITVKVDFENKYWEELLDNLNWFWRKFIAPELLTNKLKLNMARIVDDKHLVAVPCTTSNDDDSPQETARESFISLSDILNANQLDICFQSEQ